MRLGNAHHLLRCLLMGLGLFAVFLVGCVQSPPPIQAARLAQNKGPKIKFETALLGRVRRLGESEASDQNFRPWPHVDNKEKGTVVHVYGGFNKGGVEILTYPEPRGIGMLALGKRLVANLDKPNATIELRNDEHYGSVGLDLDSYSSHEGGSSSFNLNLGVLAQTLQDASEAAKPVSIWIDSKDADSAQIEVGSKTTSLPRHAFFKAESLTSGASYRAQTRITWVTWLYGAFGFAFLLGILGTFAYLPWLAEKGRRKLDAQKGGTVTDETPEEIQAKYDARKKNPFKNQLLLLILLPLLFMIFSGRKEFDKLFESISDPEIPAATVPLLMFAVGGALFGFVRLVYTLDVRRRAAKDPAVLHYARAPKKDGEKVRPLTIMMVAVVAFPILAIFLVQIPDRTIRLTILFIGLAMLLGIMFWSTWKSQKKSIRKLDDSDENYRVAQEFANEAGVKLKCVQELMQIKSPNASMALNGTLSLTNGLLEKMEPDEIRAIIAHEVGHRKARHVQKLFPWSLAISIGVIALIEFCVFFFRKQLPEGSYAFVNAPVLMIISAWVRAKLLGKKQLEFEREADLFAVQATGDPELVIRALTKVHDLNKQPHRLTKNDELMTAHPSLENRIKAIRDAYAPPVQ